LPFLCVEAAPSDDRFIGRQVTMTRWILAVLLWVGFGGVALACKRLADDEPFRPTIRKPVLGEDVRFDGGFGYRRHPLLGTIKFHSGVDFAAPMGSTVIASQAGRVEQAKVMGPYGKVVIIDHGAGWKTLYAHLKEFLVHEGDCIEAGAAIGKAGATGLATGPKLHFEVHWKGRMMDPVKVGAADEPAN
jgi:murein DD-endopeptidase MepM/ murein hydrolase activator NlpD